MLTVCDARHAGRTTVETQDVLVLARRNEELERMLREHIEESRVLAQAGSGKGKRM